MGHSKASCREGDILLHRQPQEVTFLPVIRESKRQKIQFASKTCAHRLFFCYPIEQFNLRRSHCR